MLGMGTLMTCPICFDGAILEQLPSCLSGMLALSLFKGMAAYLQAGPVRRSHAPTIMIPPDSTTSQFS